MFFSVLMSVYFRESSFFLKNALDSVFSQSQKPDEVVLVKDGKLTQELDSVIEEYVQKYPELKVVSYEENRGLGYALNYGMQYCTYDIVARMDADDVAKPDRFEKQIRVLEEHPEIGLVTAWVEEFVGTTDHITAKRTLPESPEELYEYGKSRCPANHPVTMYRKQAVFDAGGYQTELFPEDYFLWIKMLMNGVKFYCLQESLLYFRYSPETIAKRGGWKYAIDELKIQKNIYRTGYISLPRYLFNSVSKFTVRVLPLKLRMWVYLHLLRK
ncbi:MAG: glycosyltransferase [Prevotella sp.]|nr:glycosyltransferase [Prevotella sp.]